MSLVYNLLAGGSHLSDLEELRNEAATREHHYGLGVPVPTTAGEYLPKFTIGHIKKLEGVVRAIMHKAARLIGGEAPITLILALRSRQVLMGSGADRYSVWHLNT